MKCRECHYTGAIKWNPHNEVTQCLNCGHILFHNRTRKTTAYQEAVVIEREIQNRLKLRDYWLNPGG